MSLCRRPGAVHGHPLGRRGRRPVRLPPSPRPQEYEEALAEARAAAWTAWHGLVERGKDPVEVGVHGIAANAIRWVRNGRKVGNPTCGRGAMDVYHPKAQAACGFTLVSLDSGDVEQGAGSRARTPGGSGWPRTTRSRPADEAAFRLDFEGWLAGLPERKRRVAELLAEGHEGVVVARTVGIAPSRVTQLRSELAASWRAFQAGAVAT